MGTKEEREEHKRREQMVCLVLDIFWCPFLNLHQLQQERYQAMLAQRQTGFGGSPYNMGQNQSYPGGFSRQRMGGGMGMGGGGMGMGRRGMGMGGGGMGMGLPLLGGLAGGMLLGDMMDGGFGGGDYGGGGGDFGGGGGDFGGGGGDFGGGF